MAQRIPHHRPGKPRQSKEVVGGQGQIEGAEGQAGSVQSDVLEEEEAGGSQEGEPGPALLAGHLVRPQGAVLSQSAQAGRCALHPEHGPGCRQVPEHLLLDLQGSIGVEAAGREQMAEEEDAAVEGEARAHQLEAHSPGGVVHG